MRAEHMGEDYNRVRRQLRPLLFDAIALLLAAATWIVFMAVDGYRDVSGELLVNPSFDAGLDGWRASKDVNRNQKGTIDLSNSSAGGSLLIDQDLARPASGFVRLTADVRIRGVRLGPESWQGARIDVLGQDSNGQWHWDFPNKLFSVTGTRDLHGVSQVIGIPRTFSRIRVECELTGGTGTYLVDRVSVREAAPLASVVGVKWALLAAWALLAGLSVAALMRRRAWREATVLAAGGAFLLFIPDALRLRVEAMTEFPNFHLSLDHLALFAVMTVLTLPEGIGVRSSQRHSIWHLAILGVAVEAIQFYLPGRTTEFVDILSNFLGIWLGCLISETANRLRDPMQLCDELHL